MLPHQQPISVDDCEPTTFGTLACASGKQYFVRNVYPPIQELQPQVLFVVVIFVLCFVMGICGNSSVLTIIRGIVSERRHPGAPVVQRRSSADNTILYIAALCLVDFLMSLSLPPAILDSIIGFWMFGTVICKLHHVCGSVGRIVSTFLITAMSFDRYVAVCHPYQTKLRSRHFVISIILILWICAFVLLSPMLIYAKANEILLHQAIQPAGVGVSPADAINLTRMRVYKCADMMPPYVFYWFTTSTFVTGYLFPLCLIVFFNSRLIRKLYRHTKIIPRSGIPLRRISIYTILIAVLYFVCWTPYWCSVLYATYRSATAVDGPSESSESELLVYIIYCVHALPYFGSATNWILYGLLNTQLQIRHDSSGGAGGGGSVARGSVGPSAASSTYANSTGKYITNTCANSNDTPALALGVATTPDSVNSHLLKVDGCDSRHSNGSGASSGCVISHRHNSTSVPTLLLAPIGHGQLNNGGCCRAERSRCPVSATAECCYKGQRQTSPSRSRSHSQPMNRCGVRTPSEFETPDESAATNKWRTRKEPDHGNGAMTETALLISSPGYQSERADSPQMSMIIEHREGDQKL